MDTPFKELAELCEKLEKTTKRITMANLISSFLKELRSDEIKPAVRLIIGRTFPAWSQETLEISWRTVIKTIKDLTGASNKDISRAFSKTGDPGDMTKILMEKRKKAKQTTLLQFPLTILNVYKCFVSIADAKGSGSKKKKESLLYGLLSRATPLEAKYIVKDILGEMRHGVSEGLMEEAIAKASGASLEQVKRAHMLLGDLGDVAYIALTKGVQGLKEIRMRLFHPIKPMLAQPVENVKEALKEHGGKTSFEYKLDGARVQIHIKNGKVAIFSRRLTNVTQSLPDIVKLILEEIKVNEAVLEGEVIAIGEKNKPLPFQHLMRRFHRVKDIEKMTKEIPVQLYLFDILYLNGKMLIDKPYMERWEYLKEVHGNIHLAPRIVTNSPEEAQRFFEKAKMAGHEGLIAKKLDSNYTPGIRGKKWLKIKGILDTLDLVIVAADWGYGRRHEWLSDYYLAVRDEKTGEFLVIGKTFKGLTDEEFKEMTKRLLELKIAETGGTVYVKPEVVVEVAFDEIQQSPKYKSGFALRFARITRIREDKGPDEADTIERVREIYERQFRGKDSYLRTRW
ncbi:MAG: ATP-dependent DNA ligase [Candidatus Baldrarchaeia archaeon]